MMTCVSRVGAFSSFMERSDGDCSPSTTTQDSSPQTNRYRIPVGEFFTGEFEYLVFANDHDVPGADAESVFSNVRIFEDAQSPEPVDDSFTATSGRSTIFDVIANDMPRARRRQRANAYFGR